MQPTYLWPRQGADARRRGVKGGRGARRCFGWVRCSGLGGEPLPCVLDAQASVPSPLPLPPCPPCLSLALPHPLPSTRAADAGSRNDRLPPPPVTILLFLLSPPPLSPAVFSSRSVHFNPISGSFWWRSGGAARCGLEERGRQPARQRLTTAA